MNVISTNKSVSRILLSLLIAVLCVITYVSLPSGGGEAYALGENWEDCDRDGYDDSTGVPLPWIGFDYTNGDTVPEGWDGQTHPYSYYFPDAGSGGTTSEGAVTKDVSDSEIVSTSINTAKVTAIKNQNYNGSALTPSVEVALEGKTLVKDTDYTVLYVDNVAIGKASVIVTGKSLYRNTVVATFNIVPKAIKVKSAKVGKKVLTIKWAKAPKAAKITKYEVHWKVKGAKSWSAAKAVSASKASFVVKKLKKGKKYQVQARAYKKVGGVKYVSAWSNIKTSAKVK